MNTERKSSGSKINAGQDSPRPVGAGEEDLLGVIADVEKQLDHLRHVRAEREDARQRLEAREAALKQREREIEDLASRVRAMQEESEAKRRGIDEAAAAVQAQRLELDAERQRVAQDAQRRGEELRALAGTIEQREQRLAEGAGALSRERAAVESRAAELARQEQALAAAREELRTHRTELERKMAELNAAASEAQREAQDATAELARWREQAEASKQRAEELAARVRELEAAAEREAMELAASREKAGEEERRAKEMSELLEVAQEEVRRSGEAQAALMAELGEKARLLEESSERASEWQRRIDEQEAQIQERDQRIAELGSKLGGATGKLREVSQTLQEQGELVGQARALESELREKEERVRELEARLEAAPAPGAADEAQVTELREQAESLAAALSAARAEFQDALREREERLRELEAQVAAGPAGGASDDAGAADMREQARALAEELRASRAELEEALLANQDLGARLRDASRHSHEPAAGDGEAVMTRWRRLRLMRSLLNQRAEKLKKGGEALRQRYEQCEDVLAQRDQLMAAKTAIGETKAKLERMQSRAAKGKAVAMVFHAAATAAILAGISWVTAGHFAPATYAIKAVIAADSRGAEIAPEQLEDWQTFHEGLLLDPSLVQVAAERMEMRGTVSLSTPGALLARLKADLSHQSPAPGKLVVELRGQGAAPTVRTLETYITAVVSQANASRERRGDGLSTVIAEAPLAGAAPIADQRPVYALGIFAAGIGLAMVLGTVVWRKLATAKLRFEEEQQIDSILDKANWEQEPKVLSRR